MKNISITGCCGYEMHSFTINRNRNKLKVKRGKKRDEYEKKASQGKVGATYRYLSAREVKVVCNNVERIIGRCGSFIA